MFHSNKKSFVKSKKSFVETLPIYPYLPEIFEKAQQNKVSCIMADTGSGKSTLIPTYLATHGKRCIVVTPTVASTKNLAQFTRQHYPYLKIGLACGGKVEYNPSHQLVYCTAGHLYRRLMSICAQGGTIDYDFIILDEAHTESVDYGVLESMIKYMKENTSKLSETHLLISSATLSEKSINAKWFDFCNKPVQFTKIDIPLLPITETFEKTSAHNMPAKQLVRNMVQRIVDFNRTLSEGHFLVFVSGIIQIDELYNQLMNEESLDNTYLYIAHSSVPDEDMHAALNQQKPMKGDRQRSIILSTDVCETSVTIPWVVLVLDSGRQKIMELVEEKSTLKETMASNFALRQRRGRTGRTNPGHVHRMFTEYDAASNNDTYGSELERVAIHKIVVDIISYGLIPEDILPKEKNRIDKSIEFLVEQKLIDENRQLTKETLFISGLPVDLHLGIAVYRTFTSYGWEHPATQFMLVITSIVEICSNDSLVYYPKRNRDEDVEGYNQRILNHKNKFLDTFLCRDDLSTQLCIFVDFLQNVCWSTVPDPKLKFKPFKPFHKRMIEWSLSYSINNKKLKQVLSLWNRLSTHVSHHLRANTTFHEIIMRAQMQVPIKSAPSNGLDSAAFRSVLHSVVSDFLTSKNIQIPAQSTQPIKSAPSNGLDSAAFKCLAQSVVSEFLTPILVDVFKSNIYTDGPNNSWVNEQTRGCAYVNRNGSYVIPSATSKLLSLSQIYIKKGTRCLCFLSHTLPIKVDVESESDSEPESELEDDFEEQSEIEHSEQTSDFDTSSGDSE